MIIDSYNKQLLEPIARHEAGHFVVAKVLGFETEDIKFKANNFSQNNGNCAINLNQSILNIDDLLKYCEKRVMVLYAGAIAQSLQNGIPNNDILQNIFKTNAISDCDKIREHIFIIRNIKYSATVEESEIQQELDIIDDELFKKTIPIVIDNNDIIKSLANQLLIRIKKYGDESILKKGILENMPMIKEIISKQI
jgi:hypothetical protein